MSGSVFEEYMGYEATTKNCKFNKNDHGFQNDSPPVQSRNGYAAANSLLNFQHPRLSRPHRDDNGCLAAMVICLSNTDGFLEEDDNGLFVIDVLLTGCICLKCCIFCLRL
jgi:hypothetical protein